MTNFIRTWNWLLVVAGFFSATNSVLHRYLLQNSWFYGYDEQVRLSPVSSIVTNETGSPVDKTTKMVTNPFTIRSRFHEKTLPPRENNNNSNMVLTKKQNRLQRHYLNATRLKQSGHFDQVAKAWTRPFRERSIVQVCSLQRRKRISRIRRQEFLAKNQPPPIFAEPIQGMYYVKVPKSGSSTLAGINQRIALWWGNRLHGSTTNHHPTMVVLSPNDPNLTNTTCTHAEGHIYDTGRYYGNRILEKSFLWGSIRDPAARALSRVFFSQISQNGESDNDRTVLKALKKSHHPQFGTTSEGRGGFQLQYLAMNYSLDPWFAWNKDFPTMVQHVDVVQAWVQNVTQQYDFIAVTERMDESLVALQLLLGLQVGDILQSSAKQGGGYHVFNETCVKLQKARISPAVMEYLESDEWQAFNYGDYLLYAAVNQSLDLTIEQLGRERFDAALATYRAAKQVVEEKCAMETFFPCSQNGTMQIDLSRQNCYQGDEGCGYPCIDRTTAELGL